MSTFPKSIYRFNTVPAKTPVGVFVEINKLILKFVWKSKGTKTTTTKPLDFFFEKEERTFIKHGNQGRALLEKNTNTQINGREWSPKIEVYIVNWFLTKAPRQCNEERKGLLNKWCCKYWTSVCKEHVTTTKLSQNGSET